jgi:hypothetical protein
MAGFYQNPHGDRERPRPLRLPRLLAAASAITRRSLVDHLSISRVIMSKET